MVVAMHGTHNTSVAIATVVKHQIEQFSAIAVHFPILFLDGSSCTLARALLRMREICGG